MQDYNRIGLGLKNPVDVIGQDMINNGENQLKDYQYMVAVVLVLSAIFLFVIVHYYCKKKQYDDFAERSNSNVPQKKIRSNINSS
jgi:hypothetical protein